MFADIIAIGITAGYTLRENSTTPKQTGNSQSSVSFHFFEMQG